MRHLVEIMEIIKGAERQFLLERSRVEREKLRELNMELYHLNLIYLNGL